MASTDEIDAQGYVSHDTTVPMDTGHKHEKPQLSQAQQVQEVGVIEQHYSSFPGVANESAAPAYQPYSQTQGQTPDLVNPAQHGVQVRQPYSPLDLDEDPLFRYKMNHPRRGMAIIINNRIFDPRTRMKERKGTDSDAAYMYQVFKSLGFDVNLYNNLTTTNMIKLLGQVAAYDHGDSDAFACAILSHGGDQGVVFGTDATVSIDSLVAPFKGDKCASLAGKPKLFFIQACRGNKFDEGVELSDGIGDEGEKPCRIPTEADFLMAYSTTPGYFSWRNSTKGSWFIQAISKVFSEYGSKKEIMWLMTKVNQIVAYDFQSNASQEFMNQKKQVPSIVSMLTKQLHFKPKK